MSVIGDLFAHRRSPRTAFVCGGGGNLGAIQVGMLAALVDRGIRPDIVIGCSVGALNGAAVATDPSDASIARLRELWSQLDGTQIFPGRLTGPWQLVRKGEALYANDGLRATIERWLPYRTFEETAVPLEVVATCMRTGRERWFTSGAMVEPLLASAALPAVFPPVWIDGQAYLDGGVVNNVPVSRAILGGARRVYVLNVGNFERRRPLPQRPLDVLVQAFSIARTHRYRDDIEQAPSHVEMITLPGIDPGPLRYNDFSRSAELIDQARTATAAYLDAEAWASSSG